MDGILIINKPRGYTSHDVVAVVRKKLNQKKCGHIGTLDPNAVGVLPILLGQATKISKYLIEHNKTYEAVLQLGEKKDTGDILGNTIEKKNTPILDKNEIKEILNSFRGKTNQIPPMYSAIKINGKKLYEYAREGKVLKLEPRPIEIHSIDLIKIDKKNLQITFKVNCSKGTYIRVLCEDIALKLKTVGYMSELTRTSVDKFNIKNSIKLDELSQEIAINKLISIEETFENNENIELSVKDLGLFLNGVMLTRKENDGVYKIYSNSNFIGLGIIKNSLLKRDVII